MNPLEWARRRAGTSSGARAIDELREGEGSAERRTGQNRAWLHGIATFYDELARPGAATVQCNGSACAFAGGEPAPSGEGVACLGRCYEAPARSSSPSLPIPFSSMASEPVVLRHLLNASDPFRDYDLPDGETILARVVDSRLRGRGGAAYPTGAKWKVARDTPAPERYVVANGDEGDPGAYVDRLLLEETPHSVLAGMLACARAIGAGRGIVYVRGEYPTAAERMLFAIEEAKRRGALLGFHVDVVRGAGSYVAGEETALLRSIEGQRAEPAVKPPYPAERGLHGLPTIVQNVETLSVVPWVVRHGTGGRTKAVCLSGAVQEPGVVEIELGTSLRRVLEEGGGAIRGRPWKMALVGGPMGRVVPEHEFDVALDYDALPGFGHGGIVVFDASVDAHALAEHLFAFDAHESCGSCTPCRVGTAHLASRRDAASFERLLRTIEEGSLCGFGQGVPRPLRDLVRHYPGEVFR